MLRICVGDEPITDKVLAKTLLKGGVSGLNMGWRQDLGGKEVIPGLYGPFGDRYIPLTEMPSGVHEVFWEKDGSMEQLVFTNKAIFYGTSVYPIGSGISRIGEVELKSLQIYLNGSGMRVIAYGDDVDPTVRKYQPYRASENIPELFKGMVILGQVDLSTGEIWPIPKEAR